METSEDISSKFSNMRFVSLEVLIVLLFEFNVSFDDTSPKNDLKKHFMSILSCNKQCLKDFYFLNEVYLFLDPFWIACFEIVCRKIYYSDVMYVG